MPPLTQSSAISRTQSDGRLRVVIVGGGVAALEGALALAQLAPHLTDAIVIAPNTEFVDRPMTVCEPLDTGRPAVTRSQRSCTPPVRIC
jgi:NADH dehydrogenase FAD-containing subunit